MRARLALAALAMAGSALVSFAMPMVSSAAPPVKVTSSNPQGFTTADTRPGGSVKFTVDQTAPGLGALRLTTDATTAAKAQYMHAANVPLSSVDELGYLTKQNSASFAGGAASYQLAVYLQGPNAGFTTFVYEPYENGTVSPGVWQQWDVDAGKFWSSRTVTCSGGGVTAGAGGAPFYTLTQIKTMCPSAVAIGFGVNIGTFNPSYDVEADLVDFDGKVYDFEPTVAECLNGGWKTFTEPTFTHQGACTNYITGTKERPFR